MGATGNLDLAQYFLFAGGPAAVACLGWWLSGKFQEAKDHGDEKLAAHELKDQERFDAAARITSDNHLSNLRRFGRIGMELMRINPNLRITDENVDQTEK